MSLDDFINKFNGFTEPYYFYNKEIELRYEPKQHIYYLVTQDGGFIPQDGVTTVLHIIDKSEPLIRWACKMMANKLLASVSSMVLPTGDKILPQQTFEDFEKVVLESKSAHQERLAEAANIGSIAHAWIEDYINSRLANDPAKTAEITAKLPENDKSRSCCLAALDWMAKHRVLWLSTERKIYSRKYGYAGTMDGLCKVDSCDNPLCCPTFFTDRLSVADWKSSNQLNIEYIFQTAAYEHAHEEEFGVDIEDRWIIRLGKEDGEFDPWHFEHKDFADDFQGFLNCLKLYRSVNRLKARVKATANVIKAANKERARQEKEAALKIKCKGADKYKGIRPPRCNSGNPCEACVTKYNDRQQDMNVARTAAVI